MTTEIDVTVYRTLCYISRLLVVHQVKIDDIHARRNCENVLLHISFLNVFKKEINAKDVIITNPVSTRKQMPND